MNEIKYKPIGTIHTPFKQPQGTPIQPRAARGVEGTVEILPEYAEGLKDLKGFSHLLLIYHFHLAGKTRLRVKPFLDNAVHGVFSTRAPCRPNPIGLSVVRLVRAEGRKLLIQDVDIVDNTPLLDIKPYVPEFDIQDVDKKGWIEKNVNRLPGKRDDGRFASKSRSLQKEKGKNGSSQTGSSGRV